MIILLKFLLRKNGYFDRVRLVELSQTGTVKFMILSIYRKWLKLQRPKKFDQKSLSNQCWQMMSQAFEPINFLSKIKNKLKKCSKKYFAQSR